VISPIDGRVSRALVTRGNLVSGGQGDATLLTTVVSVDPIYASFDADEQTFLRYGARRRADVHPQRHAAVPRQPAGSVDRNHQRPRRLPQRGSTPDSGSLRPP